MTFNENISHGHQYLNRRANNSQICAI